MLVLSVLAIRVALASCGIHDGKVDEKPNYNDCTLQIGEKKLKPVRVFPKWQKDVECGEHRLVIRKNAVGFLNKTTGKELALVKSPSERELQWLGVSKYIACFTEDRWRASASSPIVRRLDLEKRVWLAPMTIRRQEKSGASAVIDAVLVDDDGTTVVLNRVVESEKSKSYVITLYPRNSANAIWSVTYPASADEISQDYFESVVFNDEPLRPDIRQLSWLDDAILICAGPKEDILCLERKTGKKRWRIPRIWEYERGFVGAGIGEFYITRWIHGKAMEIGLDDEAVEAARKELARAEKQKSGSRPIEAKPGETESFIVGGPLAVGGRVFVAVGKGPSDQYRGYLTQCRIYELAYGPRGASPVSITDLPRLILGGEFFMLKDDLIWECHAGSFVKICKSEISDDIWKDDSDKIGRIDWYREIKPRMPVFWLSQEPVFDGVAWTPTIAFRTVAGGYILKDDRSMMHLPVSAIACQNGLDQTIILTVPLAKPATLPKSNVRLKGNGYKLSGSYLPGIRHLTASGSGLRFAIASKTGIAEIEFSLESVLSALTKK